MKFAHEFQVYLAKEGFPSQWVDAAIPYVPLKKIIKKVRKELEEIGLNPAELAVGVTFRYDFDDGDEIFKPKLTLYYEGDLDEPVDGTLSALPRDYLTAAVAKWGKDSSGFKMDVDPRSVDQLKSSISDDPKPTDHLQNLTRTNSGNDSHKCRVEIPMTFDAQFFGLLQEDVFILDNIHMNEQKAMTEQIMALSKDMTLLTSPSKFRKTDMYRWRVLFDIYLQAQIFFSTREQDHGSRCSVAAKRQLLWFQSEVTKRGLHESFKLPASVQAFSRFVAINATLLQHLRYQEINHKAIGKILKSRFCHISCPF